MVELGVNIDHVATLRQARREGEPDLIAAAKVCEIAGAHQITVHLRQDRRHIQDRDVYQLKDVDRLKEIVSGFHTIGTKVSMFIDPELEQVDASAYAGADFVELHTGAYSNAKDEHRLEEINRIIEAGAHAMQSGLIFNAGHGLNKYNLPPIASIPGLNEVNIGHSIISRAVFVGLDEAVTEILGVLESYSA